YAEAAQKRNLADINISLIGSLAARLKIAPRVVRSSTLPCSDHRADERLVCLVRAIDPRGTYLSGRGASSYHDPERFAAADLGFSYTEFAHPVYPQGNGECVTGLSILDPLFWLGWERTGAMLQTGQTRQ